MIQLEQNTKEISEKSSCSLIAGLRLSIMKLTCPLHRDVELVHTEFPDGESKDYCPKCQELFGEKI